MGARQVHQVQGGDAEKRASALAVGGGEDRRVDVEEAALLEEAVDRRGEDVAHAEDGADGVAARAQVGDLAQELHRVTLLLKGVGGRVGVAIHFDHARLQLYRLPGARRGHQLAADAQARPGRHPSEGFRRHHAGLHHHLQVTEAGAIVHLDEVDASAIAPRFHPPVRLHRGAHRLAQDVADVAALLDHVRSPGPVHGLHRNAYRRGGGSEWALARAVRSNARDQAARGHPPL